MKGVGRIYQQTFVDTYSKVAFAKLYDRKTPLYTQQRQATTNVIRGLMKTFGLVIARGASGLFAPRVREAAAGNGTLLAIVEPLLAAWQALREQIAVFDRQILSRAKTDAVIRRLMTIPGVGAIVALSYTAVIDDPARFRRSSSVGVYAALTPRRYQSGEIDVSGHISRCGDSLLRSHLFEAANVMNFMRLQGATRTDPGGRC